MPRRNPPRPYEDQQSNAMARLEEDLHKQWARWRERGRQQHSKQETRRRYDNLRAQLTGARR